MANVKRVWTIDEIANLVQNNDTVLYRALNKLFECQTEDEKNSYDTHESNGVGFNGVDAPILTSFAEFYRQRGYLSDRQKAIARKKLVKYKRQLTNLANN